jgi:protein-tyrosine sulfotransferase
VEPPIFILSDFRSGSTLLRYVVDAHPRLCCPAELRLAYLCQRALQVASLLTTGDDVESLRGGSDAIDCVRRIVEELMES